MNKHRIIIDTSAQRGPKTGISQYVTNLVSALSQRDDILVCTTKSEAKENGGNHLLKYSINLYLRALFPNIQFLISVARDVIENILFSLSILNKNYDLYHGPNVRLFHTNLKKVVTIHDISWIKFPELHPTSRVKILNKQINNSINNSVKIITDSNFTRNELIKNFKIERKKIVVVHLGVDKNIFKPRMKNICAAFLDAKNLTYKSFLLCVGTLEPKKNLVRTILCH